MLPNNHRFTMLSADDVALCRAHSEAIDQDGYSRMLVAEVVVESDFKRSGRAVLPADLPMPPSYWDDLEHWLKTLAPAKPAAPQPFFEWPEFMKPVAARLASTSSAADGAALIGANPAVPAQQPAQKASTHSVCIKAHMPGVDWKVGEVFNKPISWFNHPEYWRPCDESGWVTHVPKRDSVCPVPDDINYEAIYRDGSPVASVRAARLPSHVILWRLAGVGESKNDIIAWRPVAQS